MSPDRQPEGADEVSLGELVRVAIAGWRNILFTAVALGLLFFVYAIGVTPSFRVDSLLQVEPRSAGFGLPAGFEALSGSQTGVSTEVEILKSRMVLGEVVTALDLDLTVIPKSLMVVGPLVQTLGLPAPDFGGFAKYGWTNDQVVVSEFEIPESLMGKRFTIRVGVGGAYDLVLPDGSVLSGAVKQRLAEAQLGLAVMIDTLDAPMGREFTVIKALPSVAIERLALRLKVEETGRQTSLLRISITDPIAAKGVAIINAVTQSYVGQNIERSSAKVESTLVFITAQLPKSEAEVSKAQDALNAYRQTQKSVDIGFETRSLLEGSREIEAKLSELNLREAQLKENYTVNHPAYQALLTNRAGLEQMQLKLKSEAEALPETQKEVFNLTRDLEVSQKVYLELLGRQQELQVMRAATIGSVRVIDEAQAGSRPVGTSKAVIIVLGLILGGLGGLAWVILRNLNRKGVLTADEIERVGLSVFATVDQAPQSAISQNSKQTPKILALTHPDDLVLESLRSLRTALHFGMLDAKTNSVLLTSAAPGAGKSFTAINLAVVMAQSGQRVCLIDGDMRRGQLRRYFGLSKQTEGLAELLAGTHTLSAVLKQGMVENLSFIATGKTPPNPSELLMRHTFAQALQELNTQFDTIIVDAPPVLAVTDPIVIGRTIGTVLMIVRHMQTPIGEVEAVRKAFETTGTKITGVILNGYRAAAARKLGAKQAYSNYRYSYKPNKD